MKLRKFAGVGLFIAGAIAGVILTGAVGHPPTGRPHRGPVLLELMGSPVPLDARIAEDRAAHLSRRLGVEAAVTQGQQDQLNSIVRAAAKDIVPLQERLRSMQGQLVDLLTAGDIKQPEVERLS